MLGPSDRTEHSRVALDRGAATPYPRAPLDRSAVALSANRGELQLPPMPRLVIDPDDENRTATRELRDEDVAAETLRFDEAGRSQDLDDEVAEAYAEAYDNLYFESEVNEAELDDVGELLSGTVEDVEERIAAGEFDDRLEDVAAREMEGDGRTTVFDVIERRKETVEYGENGASGSEAADTDEADASDDHAF